MRLFSTILLATVLLASSCKKECSPGTGGSNCDVEYRTAIIKQWHFNSACFSGSAWDMSIEKGSGQDGVIITNIDNTGAVVTGKMKDETTCLIEMQTVNDATYVGTITTMNNGNGISVSLTKNSDQCSFVGSKKN